MIRFKAPVRMSSWKKIPPQRSLFGRTSLIFLALAAGTLLVCLLFEWQTRDAMANLPFLRGNGRTRSLVERQKTLVDLSSWKTATALSAMAVSAEEKSYAQDAEHLADHVIDQAFAASLRLAALKRRNLTGEAKQIAAKVNNLQDLVRNDQAEVNRLKAAVKADESQTTSSADDLEVAQAQLGLDQDELNDAQEDLARASGDERGKIQQELTEHEAEMKKYESAASGRSDVALASARNYRTLARRFTAWNNQTERNNLLLEAAAKARKDAAELTARHNALEAQVGKTAGADLDRAGRLAGLREKGELHQVLSIYDDSIQTYLQIAAIYEKWSAQVLLQHRTVLHLMLQSLAAIAAIVVAAIVIIALLRRWMERPTLDRRHAATLSTIVQLAVQFLAFLMILLIVFGPPNELSTVIGLVTAGLTVALQDFILAFVGWFLLMGRNGIRVGDTVEIDGVVGEVLEVGLFRTTLQETGNWTDTGHPTGRRVAFNNKFAISGKFFNFSTAGQWMWDEITVSVPSSKDTYAAIERVHKAIDEETAADTRLAEEEWKRSARGHSLQHFRAAPAVNLRPTGSGINLVVRYVARASERFDRRNRISERILVAMEKPETT